MQFWKAAGHRVIATFDADEAIEALERVCDVQRVITDMDMPGSMEGLRLAAAIRDRWPPIHLIVVTGLAPPNRSELPWGAYLSQSRMARLKFSQRYDTFGRPSQNVTGPARFLGCRHV